MAVWPVGKRTLAAWQMHSEARALYLEDVSALLGPVTWSRKGLHATGARMTPHAWRRAGATVCPVPERVPKRVLRAGQLHWAQVDHSSRSPRQVDLLSDAAGLAINARTFDPVQHSRSNDRMWIGMTSIVQIHAASSKFILKVSRRSAPHSCPRARWSKRRPWFLFPYPPPHLCHHLQPHGSSA
jgi:hypothetical protein